MREINDKQKKQKTNNNQAAPDVRALLALSILA
jgi:hypothetical protein